MRSGSAARRRLLSCPTGPDAGSSADSVIYEITVLSIEIGGQGVGLESSDASRRHSPGMHSTNHPDVKTTSRFFGYTRSRSSLLELARHASSALARLGMRSALAPEDEPGGAQHATCDRMAAGQSMGTPPSCHRSADANVYPDQRQWARVQAVTHCSVSQ
jgi:hypothetical protein